MMLISLGKVYQSTFSPKQMMMMKSNKLNTYCSVPRYKISSIIKTELNILNCVVTRGYDNGDDLVHGVTYNTYIIDKDIHHFAFV